MNNNTKIKITALFMSVIIPLTATGCSTILTKETKNNIPAKSQKISSTESNDKKITTDSIIVINDLPNGPHIFYKSNKGLMVTDRNTIIEFIELESGNAYKILTPNNNNKIDAETIVTSDYYPLYFYLNEEEIQIKEFTIDELLVINDRIISDYNKESENSKQIVLK